MNHKHWQAASLSLPHNDLGKTNDKIFCLLPSKIQEHTDEDAGNQHFCWRQRCAQLKELGSYKVLVQHSNSGGDGVEGRTGEEWPQEHNEILVFRKTDKVQSFLKALQAWACLRTTVSVFYSSWFSQMKYNEMALININTLENRQTSVNTLLLQIHSPFHSILSMCLAYLYKVFILWKENHLTKSLYFWYFR